MAAPSSRKSLIDYAKRQLGAPLLEINVEDSQIDNLLDDTIQLYQERVYDGIEEVYLKYLITQTDIDNKKNSTSVPNPNGLSFLENKNYLRLPDYIIGVSEVLITNNSFYKDMFGRSPEFFMYEQFNFFGVGDMNLTDIYITRQYINEIQNVLSPENKIEFNKTTDKLYLDFDIDSMLGKYIVIVCQRAVDPTTFTKIYNSRFVKSYFTILMKIQWGQNLRKFSNITLPGNVSFNADAIYNDGIREKAEFLANMGREWEEMTHFIMG